MNKIISTRQAPKAIGPYSQAIVNNGLVYTSGQISIDPETELFFNGTIEEQTELVIKNLKSILLSAGSDLDKAIKVTIYLKNMDDFDSVNKIYAGYFLSKPARATVEVSKLPKDALVEIDCIAYI